MSLDEETLQQVAREGEMDYSKWPNIIEPLLKRLNQIVIEEFAIPRPFPNLNRQTAPSSPTQTRTETTAESAPSQSTPSQIVTSQQQQQQQQPTTPIRTLPPVPLFPNSSATHVTESAPASQDPILDSNADNNNDSSGHPLSTLPAPLIQLLASITTSLRSSFLSKPPHTIQRLAELILEPRKHYYTLPAWLRAVDRVVNVSSSADIFPLSDAPGAGAGARSELVNGINGETGSGILWNNRSGTGGAFDEDCNAIGLRAASDLGSDESLGGALLTPIPWLRNRASSIEVEEGDTLELESGDGEELHEPGPVNSDHVLVNSHQGPLVPEREDGAVTQGELIRMEQEAGVVPVLQHGPPPRGMEREDEMGDEDGEDGVPHARGPDLLGAVDMGKVEGREVEVRISSPPADNQRGGALPNTHDVSEAKKDESEEEFEMVQKGDEMELDSEEKTKQDDKKDEDMVLVDADGKMHDEDKLGDPSDA